MTTFLACLKIKFFQIKILVQKKSKIQFKILILILASNTVRLTVVQLVSFNVEFNFQSNDVGFIGVRPEETRPKGKILIQVFVGSRAFLGSSESVRLESLASSYYMRGTSWFKTYFKKTNFLNSTRWNFVNCNQTCEPQVLAVARYTSLSKLLAILS